jgi:hypothetical protein
LNNRKSHNSILFLTTLGVYLGLVLVGATPQVLAQAAMTKQFNVKDEVEVKDDLDKKPKDVEDPFVESIQIYFQDLDSYLRDVRKADEYLRSTYDPNEARIAGNYFGVYKRDPEDVLLAPCHRIGDSKGLFSLEKVTHFTRLPILLNPEYENANWSWGHMGCKRLDGSRQEKAAFAEIEVSKTQRGLFTYQVSIKLASSSTASVLFENLNQAFKRVDAAEFSDRQKVLWENTKLTTTSDQVLIITRLPRAGLDTLLAKSAK